MINMLVKLGGTDDMNPDQIYSFIGKTEEEVCTKARNFINKELDNIFEDPYDQSIQILVPWVVND